MWSSMLGRRFAGVATHSERQRQAALVLKTQAVSDLAYDPPPQIVWATFKRDPGRVRFDDLIGDRGEEEEDAMEAYARMRAGD